MDELRETLTRQVGPFQVWQWGLIIVGGIIVGRMIARQLGPSGDASGEPAEPATGKPMLEIPHARVGGPDASAPGSGGAAGDFRADPDAGGDLGPTTNMDWLRLASRRLRDEGTYGPAQVDTALRRYLEGQPVTADQVAIVGAALDAVGPPPEGAPSMITEPPPSSAPPSSSPPGTGDPDPDPEPEPDPDPSFAGTVNGTIRSNYRAASFVALGVGTDSRGRITRRTWAAANHGDQSGVAAEIVNQFTMRGLAPPNPERLLRLIREVRVEGRLIKGDDPAISGALDRWLGR